MESHNSNKISQGKKKSSQNSKWMYAIKRKYIFFFLKKWYSIFRFHKGF